MRKVTEPPQMMLANVAVAPFRAIHWARRAAQIRKVIPVVTAAGDFSRIAPVIIALAVGRKVDVADLGASGVSLVIARKTFPKIRRAAPAFEYFAED